MSLLPWGAMVRAAMRLGVSPPLFWGLSLREWRMLVDSGGGDMARGDLAALMSAFPDTDERVNDG